jgi:hypothetical protein
MIKHHPRHSHFRQRQEEQSSKPKEKGWYCLLHGIKYYCESYGQENKRQKDKVLLY